MQDLPQPIIRSLKQQDIEVLADLYFHRLPVKRRLKSGLEI